jgi:hypothetical protein
MFTLRHVDRDIDLCKALCIMMSEFITEYQVSLVGNLFCVHYHRF